MCGVSISMGFDPAYWHTFFYLKTLKMKIYKGLIAALCSMLFFTACSGSDDTDITPVDDATLTCSPEAIAVTETGGTYTVAVSASRKDWTSYTEDPWLKVANANTSSANGTVTVTVAPNNGTAARTGHVTVKSGTLRKTVEISQKAKELGPMKTPEGYELVWHDEFDGNTLSSDWTHERQKPGWVNNELQEYVDDGRVTSVADGHLNITCYKGSDGKIYSGRIYANKNKGVKYGYVEARILLPKGKGTWPAFWMMPVNFRTWPGDGEIDIMEEVGTVPNEVSSSIHCNAYNHVKNTQKTHAMTIDGAEGEFHVYALEWTEDAIKTYVDDKPQLIFPNDDKGDNNTWPFNKEFYVILNLAWGGDWGGMNGVDESALPCTMQVDYVRVFQKK